MKTRIFPNIPRFITERFLTKIKKNHWRLILVGFISAIILGAIIIVGADSYKNYKDNQTLIKKRDDIQKQIMFWQNVNENYSGYRDSYFNLAFLEYQLKNFKNAREYLKKSLQLDPNFKEGKKLEEILNKH